MASSNTLHPWELEIPTGSRTATEQTVHLGAGFFAAAAHADLPGGDVTAHITLTPAGNDWRIRLRCEGSVETLCDRCQGPMTISVDDSYEAPLLPSAGGLVPPGDDSDAVFYDPATGIADLLRPLADTIALSLGLCHYHPDGECDPEVEALLDNSPETGNTPFADKLRALTQDSGGGNPEKDDGK